MTIQVSLKEVVDAREALIYLSQQKLNIKLSYNISKILRKINTELEGVSKVRQEIVTRLTPKNSPMTPEVNQAILSELEVLLSAVIEIPFNKIDLSSTHIEITPRDAMALDPFCIFETVSLE